MSSDKSDDDKIVPEIVIIKRKRHADEGHHGGVWKIAYADFMTAMMAFFLVMWLINAANEETRSQVASYFNPVKLVDSYASPRGLDDKKGKSSTVEKVPEKDGAENDSTKDSKQEDKQGKQEKQHENLDKEEALFREPIKTLDEIAGSSVGINQIGKMTGSNSADDKYQTTFKYKDPFSPQSWKLLKIDEGTVRADRQVKKPLEKKLDEKGHEKSQARLAAKELFKFKTAQAKIEKPAKQIADKPRKKFKDKQYLSEKEIKKAKQNKADAKSVKALEKPKTKTAAAGKPAAKTLRIKELKKQIKAQIGKGSMEKHPQVKVTAVKDGILISLTDDANFGMFDIASARPKKELVLFMEKMARILAGKKGKIVIRGHTDARPFNSDKYDNWRLSSARAQVARFMLVRGKVPEDRFVRVEGYADKQLKIPSKPFDARNRRIEILLLDKS